MTRTMYLMALLVAGLLNCAGNLQAGSLNYDPNLPAPPPVPNAGWASDVIFGVQVPSGDSPYVLNLALPGIFTVTDDFVHGDIYNVTDFGNPILVTAFGVLPGFVLDPSENAALADPGYSKGQVFLAAGPHQLVVQGDGAGGIPAGFFTRIDSVPEPSTLVLGGTGVIVLVGLAIRRRRTRVA